MSKKPMNESEQNIVAVIIILFFLVMILPSSVSGFVLGTAIFVVLSSYLFVCPILVLSNYKKSDERFSVFFTINLIFNIIVWFFPIILGLYLIAMLFIGVPLLVGAKIKYPKSKFKVLPGGNKKIFNEYGTTTSVSPEAQIAMANYIANNTEVEESKTVTEVSNFPAYVLDGGEYKCLACNQVIDKNSQFCIHCGVALTEEARQAAAQTLNSASKVFEQEVPVAPPVYVPVNGSVFGDMYFKTEDQLLTDMINKNLEAAGLSSKSKYIPTEILTRKTIMTVIFSVLLFFYISLFFFHFPNYTYILGGIIIVLVGVTSFKYNFMAYLKKQIKARPSEKMSNIIMSVKTDMVVDRSYIITIATVLIAIVAPIIIFANPVILYEKNGDGYGVRFYAFGWKDNKTAVIPEEYKGKPVVSLRGNTFSNMKKLESVELPDTITEIRGQAFLNCTKLKEIKLPKNLKSLSGSAFKNCTSLKSIELPDSLIEMGGETFMGATSLESVKLSNNLVEIRGDSFSGTMISNIEIPASVTRIGGGAFKNCINLTEIIIPDTVLEVGGEAFMGDISLASVKLSNSLTEIHGDTFNGCRLLSEITIPDSVTRIGGHAFQNCGLVTVNISSESKLTEIGSSGFRGNSKLTSVYLPKNCYYESNAFKETSAKIYKYN